MKKIFYISVFVIALANVAFSQTTVRFSGQMSNGNHLRLDSVVVENVTRSWTETLVYPDTVFVFSSSSIAEARNGNLGLESYPNPFRGSTKVRISVPESGIYTLRMHNLSGKLLAESAQHLEAGSSLFDISLREPQTALLTVSSEHGQKTLKLLNGGKAGGNVIAYHGNAMEITKMQSAQPFALGDTLRYTGYATVDNCAVSSKKIVKAQRADENFQMGCLEGAIPGAFSISPTQTVFFSQGNLQWKSRGVHPVAGGGTGPGLWRFALQQIDFIGIYNQNISASYSDWIDLFGWGASGYNNVYPYTSTYTRSDYPDGAAYIAGTNYDWGVYNAISNGENTPGRWRTLTRSEAMYLFQSRPDASQKYGEGMVDSVKGLILLPDSWTLSLDDPFIADTGWQNVYTAQEWAVMEQAGAVFLPAAGKGDRSLGRPTFVSDIVNCGSIGSYWLATYNRTPGGTFNPGPYIIEFCTEGIYYNCFSDNNYWGSSVRLVRDAR